MSAWCGKETRTLTTRIDLHGKSALHRALSKEFSTWEAVGPLIVLGARVEATRYPPGSHERRVVEGGLALRSRVVAWTKELIKQTRDHLVNYFPGIVATLVAGYSEPSAVEAVAATDWALGFDWDPAKERCELFLSQSLSSRTSVYCVFLSSGAGIEARGVG